MSSMKSEERVDEATPANTEMRKTSLVQRFVQALFSNSDGNHPDNSEEERQTSEVKAETSSDLEKPGSGTLTGFACILQR